MFQAKKLIKRCPNGTGATQRDVSPIDDASHPHQHHRNITSQKENKTTEIILRDERRGSIKEKFGTLVILWYLMISTIMITICQKMQSLDDNQRVRGDIKNHEESKTDKGNQCIITNHPVKKVTQNKPKVRTHTPYQRFGNFMQRKQKCLSLTNGGLIAKGMKIEGHVCAVGGEVALVKAQVEEEDVLALIDSGASCSLISYRFAQERKIPWNIRIHGGSYVSAGNNLLDVVGETELSIGFGKAKVTGKFLVAKNLTQEVIIGYDLLKENKGDLMFSENQFRIQGECIPLCSNTRAQVNSVEEKSRPSDMVVMDKEHLTLDQVKALKKLIDDYEDVFSKNDGDLGKAEFIHRIELNSDTPIKSRAYRIPYVQKAVVEEEIAKMLKIGVIQRSNSDWSSPIVLVKKKDNTVRFCVDYRKVNEKTVKDNYPMPFIEEKLESYGGKSFFSSLDLTSGYWQFQVDPQSRKLTAFICHVGSFEWVNMPFGLCNAGATFQRAMESVLDGLEASTAYIDDILTASETFEEHLADLEKVLQRLRKHKLKIKPRKCTFGARETKFLGFIVSKDGLKLCPSRDECIRQYPRPRNAKGIRQFLGLASYYRKFLRNFATVMSPLSQLTHKTVNFVWTDECENAFQKTKEMLLHPPVLNYPDFNRRFILATDASNVGIGAILSQTNEEGDETVVAYASRTLNSAEKNYSTTEQELLAIVWACDRFRPYLFGVEFDLITDHKPLTYIAELKLASSRMIRWKMRLMEYAYKIMHKPGIEHVNADVLSRLEDDNIVASIKEAIIDDDYILMRQQEDEEISKIIMRVKKAGGTLNNYSLKKGILFANKKFVKSYEPQTQSRPVMPRCMIGQVLTTCHDHMSGGHLGLNKTWAKVSSHFYWPSMKKDVLDWIESCPICAAKKNPTSNLAELGSITEPHIPFDQIGIDFVGPLPTTDEGNRYILVITDYASRWVEAFPTADRKATTVAKILINEIICRHGAPKVILSDQGKEFLSNLIKEVCNYFVTKKINTTSYHPQSNGLTERFNNSLCQMLSVYCSDNQENWDVFLPIALFAYRTSVQKTLQETPFRLLYQLTDKIEYCSHVEKYNKSLTEDLAIKELERNKDINNNY